jgi:hypothetical protein
MGYDNKMMLVRNYLKCNHWKKPGLRFTYLNFLLKTTPIFHFPKSTLLHWR